MSSALRVNRVTNTVQNSCSEPPLQLFKISLSAFSVLTKRKADSGDTIAPHEQTSNAVTCALEYSRDFIKKKKNACAYKEIGNRPIVERYGSLHSHDRCTTIKTKPLRDA